MTSTWHPFIGRDLGWLLDERATSRSLCPFLIWEPFDESGRSWTYSEFRNDALCIATGLVANGVRAGDRLLIHMDNCPELLLTWFACAYLGGIGVLTNTRSASAEIRYFAEHADVVGAVTQPVHAGAVRSALGEERWLIETGSPAWSALQESDPFSPVRHEALSPLSIQYTSGTTSRPKGVVWTHANALFGAKASAEHEALRDDDVHLVYLPLYHTNALAYSVLASIWAGCRIVLQPRFSASRFWDISLRHGCTWTSMVPFCRKALTALPVPKHTYRLWGTAVCSPPDDERFGVKTLGWWGMTETISHGTVGDTLSDNPSMSMGRTAPEYQIKIVDGQGAPVAQGETGDLLIRAIRGVSLFAEYLNDPGATDDAFTPDGWFKTGDRVRTAQDGYLYFADRQKDMLKVGGENVAASEVERVIATVAGVRECAVVGKPHEMLVEVVAAFIVTSSDAPESLVQNVIEKCRTELAGFKVPQDVRIVAELPRATLNKVAKAELRRALIDEEASDKAPP